VSRDAIEELLSTQSGVVARRQLLANGLEPCDIERRLRRRELVPILRGVFVDHTGEPTWLQRAWAGVLHYEPAALAHTSALRAAGGPGRRDHPDDGPIHLAVGLDRRVTGLDGYRVRRVAHVDTKAQWNRSPPRLRIEEAALDVAADQASDFGAIEVLARQCRSRSTTPERLLSALDGRSRMRRRAWLREVLEDVAAGSCSVLERGYLSRVERAHALPRPARQPPARSDRGTIYRDVEYDELGLVVELDGRLFHDTAAQRDRDLDRDLDAALTERLTVRLGWGQVYDRPCRTAARVEALLRLRGWDGHAVPCGPDCRLRDDVLEVSTYQVR